MNDYYHITAEVKKHKHGVARCNGQTMLCPKCDRPLVITFERDVELDLCPKCRGVWIDHAGEKQILNIKPEAFSIDELKWFRKQYKPWEHGETSGYVPCPVCRELMHRRNWGSHSGVMVDKCNEHGTWYDDGELAKVREYVSLGGIEYEKFMRMEKSLNELSYKLVKEIKRLDR